MRLRLHLATAGLRRQGKEWRWSLGNSFADYQAIYLKDLSSLEKIK
jgi:hypothetical protein